MWSGFGSVSRLDPFGLDLSRRDCEHSIVASNGIRKMEEEGGIVDHVKGWSVAEIWAAVVALTSPRARTEGERGREISGVGETELTRVCHFKFEWLNCFFGRKL